MWALFNWMMTKLRIFQLYNNICCYLYCSNYVGTNWLHFRGPVNLAFTWNNNSCLNLKWLRFFAAAVAVTNGTTTFCTSWGDSLLIKLLDNWTLIVSIMTPDDPVIGGSLRGLLKLCCDLFFFPSMLAVKEGSLPCNQALNRTTNDREWMVMGGHGKCGG